MRRPSLLCTLAALLALFSGAPARAALHVSVLTFGPGAEVYERFGHTALRVRDDARGIDECFDWGNFEFTPDFTWIFVKGDLNYSMQGGKDGRRMIDFYALEDDRTVVEQTLNLSPEQTDRLVHALLVNDTDANRYYRYDYYKDNCATRLRDALESAVGGQIHPQLTAMTPHSYRWQTRRLMPVGAVNKLCTVLSDMAGGPRIDAPLSRWDACFLPTLLADELDTVQLHNADGSTTPLVATRTTLHTTSRPANADPAEPWNPIRWMLPFSLGCSAVLLVLAAYRWTILFRLAATLWQLWVLFAALFMPTIILFTWHWVVAWNENLLQFTPLALLGLIALWFRPLRQRFSWVWPAAVGLSAVGALVTISHLTPQRNAPAVALALPLHVATLLGQRWTTRPRTPPIDDSPERTPEP